jgi:hypothetical protein
VVQFHSYLRKLHVFRHDWKGKKQHRTHTTKAITKQPHRLPDTNEPGNKVNYSFYIQSSADHLRDLSLYKQRKWSAGQLSYKNYQGHNRSSILFAFSRNILSLTLTNNRLPSLLAQFPPGHPVGLLFQSIQPVRSLRVHTKRLNAADLHPFRSVSATGNLGRSNAQYWWWYVLAHSKYTTTKHKIECRSQDHFVVINSNTNPCL